MCDVKYPQVRVLEILHEDTPYFIGEVIADISPEREVLVRIRFAYGQEFDCPTKYGSPTPDYGAEEYVVEMPRIPLPLITGIQAVAFNENLQIGDLERIGKNCPFAKPIGTPLSVVVFHKAPHGQ